MYCVFGIKLKSEVASDMEIAKWRPMHSSYPGKTVMSLYRFMFQTILIFWNANVITILKCQVPCLIFEFIIQPENLQSKSLVHIVPLSLFKGCYISFLEFFGLFFKDLLWHEIVLLYFNKILFSIGPYIFKNLSYNDWNVFFVKGMKRAY